MNKEQLIPLIDSILPDVYGFAFALMGDELACEQLVIDSYTVFIMKDRNFLLDEEYEFENQRHRKSLKKYLSKELTREVYELAIKRIPQLIGGQRKNLLEWEVFYSLNINKRALMYLKEVSQFSVKDLQEIFCLERHQVIETFYNSRHELLTDKNVYSEENLAWK